MFLLSQVRSPENIYPVVEIPLAMQTTMFPKLSLGAVLMLSLAIVSRAGSVSRYKAGWN